MRKIFLLIAPVLLIMLAFRPVKTLTVSGTVVDESGNPIPGASVSVKGTKNATATNSKGSYTLNNVAPDAVVEINLV